jgi:hypothetical protein
MRVLAPGDLLSAAHPTAYVLCILTSGIDELDARIVGLSAAEPRT